MLYNIFINGRRHIMITDYGITVGIYFQLMATVLAIITISSLCHDCYSSGSGTGGPCPSSDLWMFDRTSKEWTSMDGHCARPRLVVVSIPAWRYRVFKTSVSGVCDN